MFKVDANSVSDYFSFDPVRARDLKKLDALIRKAAPSLVRHFHAGTPAGSAGMRMKMIGYGKSSYTTKAGKTTPWPVIGVALQKSYISLYLAVSRNGEPVIRPYAGRLGELRSGDNNFSFESFDDLDKGLLAALVADVEAIFFSSPKYELSRRQRPSA
jgi:hypothetical protein